MICNAPFPPRPVYNPENPQELLPEDQWLHIPVNCEQPEGPNATTNPVYQMEPNGMNIARDENGEFIVLVPGVPFHLHKGYWRNETGEIIEICNWEDVVE
jgi:hypothetical protein